MPIAAAKNYMLLSRIGSRYFTLSLLLLLSSTFPICPKFYNVFLNCSFTLKRRTGVCGLFSKSINCSSKSRCPFFSAVYDLIVFTRSISSSGSSSISLLDLTNFYSIDSPCSLVIWYLNSDLLKL